MRSPLISGEDRVWVAVLAGPQIAARRSPLISGEDASAGRVTGPRRRRRNEVPADQRGGRSVLPLPRLLLPRRNEVPADQRGGHGPRAGHGEVWLAAMRPPLISGEDRGS